jgi:hypothetical protein
MLLLCVLDTWLHMPADVLQVLDYAPGDGPSQYIKQDAVQATQTAANTKPDSTKRIQMRHT